MVISRDLANQPEVVNDVLTCSAPKAKTRNVVTFRKLLIQMRGKGKGVDEGYFVLSSGV